uniref:Uncharacterized protein n=1 Tax=Anopheles farauti TaxID=69004 RepID=A0A182QN87_9DIPT
MKNRKLGMAGGGVSEMDFLTVPSKITPVKQVLAELQSDDEEPGLGYTHTLIFISDTEGAPFYPTDCGGVPKIAATNFAFTTSPTVHSHVRGSVQVIPSPSEPVLTLAGSITAHCSHLAMKIDGKPPYNPRRLNRYTTALLQEVGYQGKGNGEDSNENTVRRWNGQFGCCAFVTLEGPGRVD